MASAWPCACMRALLATVVLSCVGCGARTGLSDVATDEPLPHRVSIFAGPYGACALRDGELFCWGKNAYGEIGDGSTTTRARPTKVVLPGVVIDVHVGLNYTCALLESGIPMCWGGLHLDDGSDLVNPSPEPVPAAGDGAWLSSGTGQFGCMGGSAGAVACWGNAADFYGLKNAQPSLSLASRVVPGAQGAVAIASGDRHACLLTASGGIECAGANDEGQLGDGKPTSARDYAPVTLSTRALQVSAAGRRTCARTLFGLQCWGRGVSPVNEFEAHATPFLIDGLGSPDSLAFVSVGRRRICVLRTNGDVLCWGSNAFGGLGDGTTTDHEGPTLVHGLPRATQIATGDDFTCADTVDGLYCWGDGSFGQLASGDAGVGVGSLTPVRVTIP